MSVRLLRFEKFWGSAFVSVCLSVCLAIDFSVRHISYLQLDNAPTLKRKVVIGDAKQQAPGWLVGCRIKVNYPLVGRGSATGVPSIGVFLRDPSPDFTRHSKKTTENSKRVGQHVRPWSESDICRFSVLRGLPLGYWWDSKVQSHQWISIQGSIDHITWDGFWC